MCVAMLGAAVGMVGAMASYQAKRDDYAAKKRMWEQNVVNAESAARDEQRQIATRQIQEQAKTGQKKELSYLEEAQKSSAAENSAAYGGVGGISVNNILGDIARKSELNRTYIDENYKYVAADLTEKMKATDTTLMSRINSVPVPQAPSPLELFAGVAGAGVKALGGLGMS